MPEYLLWWRGAGVLCASSVLIAYVAGRAGPQVNRGLMGGLAAMLAMTEGFAGVHAVSATAWLFLSIWLVHDAGAARKADRPRRDGVQR